MGAYEDFLRSKEIRAQLSGMTRVPELSAHLFPHQRATVEFLLKAGRGDFDMPSTDVLNVKVAHDPDAEKHLCPMPLNITKKALALWSNEGDVVFSPFGGIGSEGVSALQMGRKFIGTELHPAYFKQGVKNLTGAEDSGQQTSLFDLLEISA